MTNSIFINMLLYMVCTWTVCSSKGSNDKNGWGKSSICDLIPPIQFSRQLSQLYRKLSVVWKTKTRTLLFRYGHYRRKGKIYRRSLRDCSLLASGIFLKQKLNLHSQKCLEPGPCWAADWACLHSQAGAALALQPGLAATLAALPTRTCPGGVAPGQPCWLPRRCKWKL